MPRTPHEESGVSLQVVQASVATSRVNVKRRVSMQQRKNKRTICIPFRYTRSLEGEVVRVRRRHRCKKRWGLHGLTIPEIMLLDYQSVRIMSSNVTETKDPPRKSKRTRGCKGRHRVDMCTLLPSCLLAHRRPSWHRTKRSPRRRR